MKLKFQFSHRAKIGQNDHSNPYIESTTVLSDNDFDGIKKANYVLHTKLLLIVNIIILQ